MSLCTRTPRTFTEPWHHGRYHSTPAAEALALPTERPAASLTAVAARWAAAREARKARELAARVKGLPVAEAVAAAESREE